MSGGLDKIDLKILQALQEDASRSAAEIAEAVGLSQSPCWRRIQRLKDEGYISKIVAILDRRKLDLRAQLFVQIKVEKNDQANLVEFSKAMQGFPEVLECYVIFGAYDFLLRVVAQDMTAYEKFYFEKLSRVPNIRESNSAVVVSAIKETIALPLPPPRRGAAADEEPLAMDEGSPRPHLNRPAAPTAGVRAGHREFASITSRVFA